jgi:hypothetical protein
MISDTRRAERRKVTGVARRSASALVRVSKGNLLQKQTSARRVDTHLWMGRGRNVPAGGHFTGIDVVVGSGSEGVARELGTSSARRRGRGWSTLDCRPLILGLSARRQSSDEVGQAFKPRHQESHRIMALCVAQIACQLSYPVIFLFSFSIPGTKARRIVMARAVRIRYRLRIQAPTL